jgi:hypothetical protein
VSPGCIDISLTTGNSDLSGYAGPYGDVKITLLNSTTATIVFTAAGGYLFGDGNTVDLNVNGVAANTSVTGISFTQPSGFTAPTYSVDQTAQSSVDGFGKMNVEFNDTNQPGGFSSAASSITFTLTDTTANWLSAAAVLALNAKGYEVGAHIFVCSTDPCTIGNNTGVTGFASAPLPAALPLFVSGLGLIGFAGMRKRRKAARLAAAY